MNRNESSLSGQRTAKVGGLIRARRHQLKMTLHSLGALSGVSIGYLSQVERDQASPSLSTLAAISQALDVGIDYFIAAPSAQDALTRGGERTPFSVDDSPISYEQLHSEFPGSILSAFLITIAPGYRSETANHEGEEMIFVLQGRLTLRIDNEPVTIAAGDSLHFRGNRNHDWANETNETVRLLWSGTLTMFKAKLEGSALQTAKGAGPTGRS